MRHHHLRRHLLAAVLGLALALPATAATPRTVAVDSDGQLYRLRAGTYGELFPKGGLADADEPVLALDLVAGNQKRQRLLVPGTEAGNVEDGASLLYEDSSATLFVLWQNRFNSIHSTLNLFALRDGAWNEVAEITGNPFSFKSAQQIAVTHDSFQFDGPDGENQTVERTVLHLIWWESGTDGPSPLYTPVILLDGSYIGWNPVYRLDDLAAASGLGPLLPADRRVAEAPQIEPGRDGNSVVVGFTDGAGGRMVGLEISLLPGEINVIANRVRHQIIEVGRTAATLDRPGLSQKVRHQIIEVGGRLGMHPAVIRYLADKVEATVLELPGQGITEAEADEVRHQIIEVGAHLDLRGSEPVAGRTKVVEVEPQSLDGSVRPPSSLLRVATSSERPAPEIGDGPVRLHLSESGEELLVTWEKDDALVYRETVAGGWSEARELALGESFDAEQAHEILANRVRYRP